MPMTTDPELAATWYETLPASGIEGLVVKRLDQPYPAGRRGWRKLRHTNVRDAAVVGYTGSPRRPVALVLVLPVGGETPLVSSPLTPALRAEVAAAVASGPGAVGAAGATVTAIGLGEVPFRPLDPPLTAEVRHASARHPPPEVLRLRTDL
ncbi:hypothetical protein SSAG_01958 [Streptomyces sp. Mg1]|nr:hypothetical protein SSAG_01958 [Streptomyces sp. Mg1]